MKKGFIAVAAVMCTGLLAVTLHGQAPAQNAPAPTMSGGIKNAYNGVKNNLLKAAQAMPEDGYAFTPTPAERNFGGWVAHVADAQTAGCSRVAGMPVQGTAASKTTKADLIQALQDSFTTCDAVYNALTDANATDTIAGGRGPGIRLALLANNVAHDNECYGSMAVYLRLKGIVPPSSEGRGPGGPPAGGAPPAGRQ